MRSLPALVVLIAQVWLLTALVPLAYASPPDPLWIPGIYDDGDQDDVVGMLVDDRLALADPPAATDAFAWTVGVRVVSSYLSARSAPDTYGRRPRSPPTD